MNGFCGWIGTSGDGAALAAMAERLVATTDHSLNALTGGAGIAARGNNIAVAEENGLLGAICGRPRWSTAARAAAGPDDDDAAILLAAWRRFGNALPDQVGGVFSFALVEPATGRAFAAVDRAGIHRLCYGRVPGGGLVFGSTADAVAAHPSMTSTISPQGIYNYLFFFFSPAPHTIYTEQRKLLAGQSLSFADGHEETRYYWRMPYRETNPNPPEELAAELRRHMDDAVRDAVSAWPTDQVGAFLSGGLDSSTTVGLLCGLIPGGVRSFTIGFDVEGFDESGYAQITADHFGARHTPHYMKVDDLIDVIPRITAAYDEPFGNSSAVPAYLCARIAREHGVTLMVAGDGGDELFAGNERYTEHHIFERYNRLPGALRHGAIEPLVGALSRAFDVRLLRRARNFLRICHTPMPDRAYMHAMFGETPPEQALQGDFLAAIDAKGPLEEMRDIYGATEAGTLVQRMMHLDLQRTLADNDLPKVSRTCALAGLDVVFPFLDDNVVRFSAELPESLLLAGGELRGFYKQAYGSFLARDTIEKDKHGFGLPTVQWMWTPGPVRDLVLDSIEAFRKRGIASAPYLDQIAGDIRTPRRIDRASFAWDVMILENWLTAHGH